MTPEEVEDIIGRDTIDDEIDAWHEGKFNGGDLIPPETVTLTMLNGNMYSSLQDLAWEILADKRREFASAKSSARSSEAGSAKYKVILAREILRQTLPRIPRLVEELRSRRKDS